MENEQNIFNGFIRLYTPMGKHSLIFSLTTITTVGELCENYSLKSIYLQIGNAQIK